MHAQTQAARQTPLPIPVPASLAPTDDAGAWSFVAGALRAFGADAPAAPALAVPPLVETGLDALNAVGQAAVNAAAALDSAAMPRDVAEALRPLVPSFEKEYLAMTDFKYV